METQVSIWMKIGIAGLAIAGTVAFTGAPSASAKDPQELQLQGQTVSKLVEALGEPKEKAPLPDGGQLYIYTYEPVLKGGHIMSAQPRGKTMFQDVMSVPAGLRKILS